jgi:shikimate 5-dehydrogenase
MRYPTFSGEAPLCDPVGLTGLRALQVGAGGAGSAIALALLRAGVAELRPHDVDPARQGALIRRLRERFGERVHPIGMATTSSPTPRRWACARAVRTRST